jgi:hypothetical protein
MIHARRPEPGEIGTLEHGMAWRWALPGRLAAFRMDRTSGKPAFGHSDAQSGAANAPTCFPGRFVCRDATNQRP